MKFEPSLWAVGFRALSFLPNVWGFALFMPCLVVRVEFGEYLPLPPGRIERLT